MDERLMRLVAAYNRLVERKARGDPGADVLKLLADAPPEEFNSFCEFLDQQEKTT